MLTNAMVTHIIHAMNDCLKALIIIHALCGNCCSMIHILMSDSDDSLFTEDDQTEGIRNP